MFVLSSSPDLPDGDGCCQGRDPPVVDRDTQGKLPTCAPGPPVIEPRTIELRLGDPSDSFGPPSTQGFFFDPVDVRDMDGAGVRVVCVTPFCSARAQELLLW